MTQKRFFTVDSKHSYLSLWTILLTALGVLFAEPIVASCLHSLEESMHFEDIGFIKEYLTLFTTINDYIHQEDDFQDQNEENKYENLKLWHFPTLSKVKFNGIEGRTINEAFSEFSVRPQWRTKNHTGIVK